MVKHKGAGNPRHPGPNKVGGGITKSVLRVKVVCRTCHNKMHIDHSRFVRGVRCPVRRRIGGATVACQGQLVRVPKTRLVAPQSNSLRPLPQFEAIEARSSRPVRFAAQIDFEEEELPAAEQMDIERVQQRQDAEDPDYVDPPKEFDPHMRFTPDSMVIRGAAGPPGRAADMDTQAVAIGDNNVAARLISTSSQFGGLPAWKFALDQGAPNAHRWKRGSRRHYEYCHLVACCLGGDTVQGNLVAGHFAVNTLMMVIENYISGRAGYAVRVRVWFCAGLNRIPDFMLYEVYKPGGGGPAWRLLIDCAIFNFSENDATTLEKDMKRSGL